MSVTLSSLPGKFKCPLLNVFCPDGITPNSGLTGPNNIYIYIYIYKFSDEEEREYFGVNAYVESYNSYHVSKINVGST